jgi:hypothetical protein
MGTNIVAGNPVLAARIEQETGIEILPGTEVMADIAGAHFVHASNAPSNVVLVPQPSNDPSDPLVSSEELLISPHHADTYGKNWTPKWKTLVLANQGFFVFTSIIGTLSIAPLTPIYMQAWHRSLTDVALLVSPVSSSSAATSKP